MDNSSGDTQPTQIRFGDFELDVRAGELSSSDGNRIRLQEQPLQILLILLENPGQVVSREQIRQRLWPGDTVVEFDHSIGTAIKKLRQALNDDAENPRFVETIPRRGFRFLAPVLTPTAVVAEPFVDPTPAAVPPQRPAARRIALWPVLAMVAVLVLAAGWLGWRHAHRPGPSRLPLLDSSAATQVTFSNGLDLHPSLSPDASSVAYSSDQSGRFELYVRSLASGGAEIQLTNDGQQNFEPTWSPDGKQIAYTSSKRGGIWLLPALGGTPRLLTEFGSSPVWSPDSSQVAFQSGALRDISQQSFGTLPPSTIWVVPATGGTPRQITQDGQPVGGHGHPTWSPDGGHIAFNTNLLDHTEVWSIAPNGSGLHRLVSDDGVDPVYGRDGHSLYFTERRRFALRLVRVPLNADDAATGPPEILKETGKLRQSNLSFSADGRLAVYSEQALSDNFWQIPVSPATGLATGPPRPLTNDTNWRKATPSFSPDGNRIAFNAVTAGNGRDLRIVGRDGGESRLLNTGVTFSGERGWFPDGRRICISTNLNGRLLLRAIDVESGRQVDLRAMEPTESSTRLSPDGTLVVFTATKGTATNLFIAPVAGGPSRQITFDRESASFPTWSPDGKTIAFEITHGPDTFVATVPSAGGPTTQLNQDPGQAWLYGFAPDGDKILFAGLRDGLWNVYWISRSTRKQQQLTSFSKPELYVRYPIWSPRGDQIVFEHAETTGNIWLMHLK